MTTDPLFEAVYNETFLTELRDRFGPFARHKANLNVSSTSMVDLVDKWEDKNRRGEVVMVVPNEAGQVWLHTKEFYPAGIYRLMTGGIDQGETPWQAMKRELFEETGFKAKIARCLAVITYTISADSTLPFVSYIFQTASTKGRPAPTDSSEALSEFRTVPIATLSDIARQLRAIEGHFADWGVFRAIAHDITREELDHV